MLIGSLIIVVLLVAAAGLIIYEFLGSTSSKQCTWHPTVSAPGDNHATPGASEDTREPVTDQEIIEQP
jgi:hypothetical protein